MSIGKNTAVNLAGQIAPLAVSLLVVPPYLRAIGEARYGVLLIVWMLLGYFGLFDLGLNRAVAQRVAELRDDSTGVRGRVVWTALLLAAGLSAIGALAMLVAGHYGLDRCFGVGPALQSEFMAALPWIALVLPASLLGATLSGTLQGRERFVSLNLIQTVGTVWSQVVPMAVAWFWSVELKWLVPAALSARLVTLIWMFHECRKDVPLSASPQFDASLVRSLFSFGGWVTVSSVVSPLLTTFDRFVIGAVDGATAVARYGIPFGVVWRASVLPSALAAASFPRFAVGHISARLALLTRATGALAAVFTPLCLVMMFLIGPFLSVWVGPGVATSGTLVGEIMIVGLWANGLALLPHAYLQANARPRISAIFHLVELLPYGILLWFGLKRWGVAGAALAGTVRLLGDTYLHFWATDDGGANARQLALPAGLLLAGFAAAAVLAVANPLRWIIGAGLLGLSFGWGWGRMPVDWRMRAVLFLPGRSRA